MPITYSHTITGFRSDYGVVYLDVTATDGSYTMTTHGIVFLGVHDYGLIPTGPAFTDIINNYCTSAITTTQFNTAKALAVAGGVTNANLVPELGVDAIIVALYPDPGFRNVTTASTTRSIMIRVNSRSDLTPYTGGYGIDNGNVVASQGLSSVIAPGVTDVQSGPYAIVAASDNNQNIALDSFATSYPGWANAGGPNGLIYYIEHDPIKMYNYATAVFSY